MLILFFASGVVLVVLGADWFTESAVWIAKRSGVSQVVIGATLVSLATTLPETSVSVYAAFSGQTQLAIGNAIGSAIANIGLILGIIVLVRSQDVNRRSFILNGGFLLLAALILTGAAWNGTLTRTEAALIVSVVVLFLLTSIYSEHHSRVRSFTVDEVAASTVNRDSSLRAILRFVIGAAMITVGGGFLVTSSVAMAEWLGIPPLIIGLTVLALGTSLPELATAIAATLKGHQDLCIGNIIGASFLNLTLVSGAAALVRPLPIARTTLHFDFPIMISLVLLLLAFGLSGNTLRRREGAVLLAPYLFYVTMLLTVFA